MRELGGETLMLTGEMQLGRGETIGDTAHVLSRYVDAIMIRRSRDGAGARPPCHRPRDQRPHGLTHPCQIMADVMTFEENQAPFAAERSRGRERQ